MTTGTRETVATAIVTTVAAESPTDIVRMSSVPLPSAALATNGFTTSASRLPIASAKPASVAERSRPSMKVEA